MTDPEPGRWRALAPCDVADRVEHIVEARATQNDVSDDFVGIECQAPDPTHWWRFELVVDHAPGQRDPAFTDLVTEAIPAFDELGDFCGGRLVLYSRLSDREMAEQLLGDLSAQFDERGC